MIIRSMQPTDIPACASLMANSPLWQRYQVTEASAARRFEHGLATQATICVAETADGPAGFVWYETLGAFCRSGYIMLIGVDAAHHQRGIGRVLMEHAEAQMYPVVEDIFLLVSDFNDTAQRFYQRLGYRQVGAIPDYVRPGITELIYHKHSQTS
jgi:ribosomal protein S18 acetylase RimI-like enzyme